MRARHVTTYDPIKRSLDLWIAVSSLIVLSPVLGIAALLVKLTSRGPVLYRARRAGLEGEPFDVLKLRTMVEGADRQGTITVGGDHRVTALGRLLRRTKLDEVPQMWNILRGDMSLVGPRPESLGIVREHFTPEYLEALSVRPGLTCTGTLIYYVYQEDLKPPAGMGPEEFYVENLLAAKMDGDLHYVAHRSLAYDLRLLWQTAWVMSCKLVGLSPRWTPPPGAVGNAESLESWTHEA